MKKSLKLMMDLQNKKTQRNNLVQNLEMIIVIIECIIELNIYKQHILRGYLMHPSTFLRHIRKQEFSRKQEEQRNARCTRALLAPPQCSYKSTHILPHDDYQPTVNGQLANHCQVNDHPLACVPRQVLQLVIDRHIFHTLKWFYQKLSNKKDTKLT